MDRYDFIVIGSGAARQKGAIQAAELGKKMAIIEGRAMAGGMSVPVADPHHNEIRDLSQVRAHFLREVEHFFHIYKELEGKAVETLGWEGKEAALRRRENKTG